MMSVYFARSGENGSVKIGYTEDISRRLRELQWAQCGEITILRVVEGGRPAEAWFHRHFRHLRIQGEWFTFHPDMLIVTREGSESDARRTDIWSLIDKAGGDPEFRSLCGVARTTVLDWKRTGQIPANRIARISSALGVPLAELIKLTAVPKVRSAARAA